MISLHILVHEKDLKEIIRNLSFIVGNLGSDCLSRSTRRQVWRKRSLIGKSRLYRAGSQRERERESAAAAAWSHEFCLEPVNSIN